jgi:hypothetical protein
MPFAQSLSCSITHAPARVCACARLAPELVRSMGTDNRSKGIDNRSKGIDNRSKGTDNRTKGTDNRTKGTDNRTTVLAPELLRHAGLTLTCRPRS